ncbi:MAG: hypothetical protein II336_17985 [Loktanella sp.]|nr:hypothetical protein [Loktanella sp.]
MQIDIEAIAKMRTDGLSYDDIKARTGLSQSSVGNMVRLAKNAGLLAEREVLHDRKSLAERAWMAYGVRLGKTTDALRALDRDQFEWLAREAGMVGCESIAEYLTELVRDAHAEATESL